jgi:ERCC4-type nuclease
MYSVKIDNRERALITQLENKHPEFKFITEQLPLGDISIIDNSLQLEKILIERKTLDDLSASIKDGRYDEQSYRLDGIPIHNHNIYYLIEGNICKYTDKKLLSAMFSLNYFKGFSVIRTNDVEMTAITLVNMVEKLERDYNKKYAHYSNTTSLPATETENTTTTNAENYCNVVKKLVKNKNITQENIGEIMLCQIPTISSTIAIALMNEYKTFYNLTNEIMDNPQAIYNLKYPCQNGKERRIPKSAVDNLIKYLG